ncbi:HesA/MoeB/ThiF family protein [Mumia sp. DW29H23]|uniref:HesA/MoeB/ThiF family protein n=1 Tax=Mumia sp. DW29H23 TaxID=3421241 RepID=UPI003D683C9E
MSTRIAFTEDQFRPMVDALALEHESAAVIAATMMVEAITPGREVAVADPTTPASAYVPDTALLITDVTWVPQDAYLRRTGFGLTIRSTGWVPAVRAAIREGQVPVFVHTHPGGHAEFSEWDDTVDQQLGAAAQDLGAPAYASIVIAGTPAVPAVVARMCRFPFAADRGASQGLKFEDVDAVRVAGASIRLHLPPAGPGPRDIQVSKGPQDQEGAGEAAEYEVFDRQVRMLGVDGQRTLAALNVAVIGAGGTGSAVAGQLVRIGVGRITLVDDDVVTAATPTRGHGIRLADLGQPKVDVLGEHLRDIGFGTQVEAINAPLHHPDALRAIAYADVVFSCVDGHGGRMILNRFAYAHLVPVIDLAVLVSPSLDGRVEIDERVTWVAPGTACMLCRGRLNPARAYAENLDPEARKRLAGEGYVLDVETPQPAVVTLTTLIASLGTTEFLLRLTGLGSPEPTEFILRPHLGELRRNQRPQRTGCFCAEPKFLGRGQQRPYLDLMWSDSGEASAS